MTTIFADSYEPDQFALALAAVVVSFAAWQFRVQFDKVRRPGVYFGKETSREQKFLTRQAKRRVQLACLAGIFGALMVAGLLLPYERHPKSWGIVWMTALFFLGWTGCLALVDFFSIKLHYGAELDRQRAEKLALDYKMKKMRERNLQNPEKTRHGETDSANDAR